MPVCGRNILRVIAHAMDFHAASGSRQKMRNSLLDWCSRAGKNRFRAERPVSYLPIQWFEGPNRRRAAFSLGCRHRLRIARLGALALESVEAYLKTIARKPRGKTENCRGTEMNIGLHFLQQSRLARSRLPSEPLTPYCI